MGEEQIGLLVFAGVVTTIVAVLTVLLVHHGGFRGAMFGARVEREVGEVKAAGSTFGRGLHAKVFQLAADGPTKRVGMEVRHHGKRAYAVLSERDALALAELLQRAAR